MLSLFFGEKKTNRLRSRGPRFQLRSGIYHYVQRRQWQPTPVLPGKSHGGGAWWAVVHRVVKSQTQLSNFIFTFHFHALEKEMAAHSSVLAWRIPGKGAWWAAVCGVAQSQMQLKRLSSSSLSLCHHRCVQKPANTRCGVFRRIQRRRWGHKVICMETA